MSYEVTLEKEKTIIKEYSYNSLSGEVATSATPIIAYRIILNYFSEYGDHTYTDYLVTDPKLDFIMIFTQKYDEEKKDYYYFSSQIIKIGDPVIYRNYRYEQYGLFKGTRKDNTVWITDKENYISISLYRFAVLNANYDKAKMLNKMSATL